ncbi:MAG: nucleoid-associated protein [Saprospiraceae bacterium]|nr:nucleoid-associated protein [Saprospiraceae bacterium]
MLDFSNAKIGQLITHYIGNSSHEEELILSERLTTLSEEERDWLQQYFFNPLFEKEEAFHLSHADDLDKNRVYASSSRVFQDPGSLVDASRELAKGLFELSDQPQIPSGYLNVVFIENILLDDELITGFGLFKSESKSRYFNFNTRGKNFEVSTGEGFDIRDLDKAFVCANVFAEDGYMCLVHDRHRSEGAKFWQERFLGLKPMSNAYYQTAELMRMTKSFVTDELPENFSVPRPDQIDLLNRSADYFKSHEEYNRGEFVNDVFAQTEYQESFDDYQRRYQESHDMEMPDQFELSNRAVQQQSRVFKSILKLDKNFHVYIHGDRSKIQFGRESDGRKFYKIYFDEEK